VQQNERVGFQEVAVDADFARIGHRQAERVAARFAITRKRGRAAYLDLL
jgi:hypothetical protein